MTLVKICGITNLEDALLSAKFGADMLGFNFYEKSPRFIEPEAAREIIEQVPQNVKKVGVFVNEKIEKLTEIAKTARLDAVQLHGEETPEFVADLQSRTDLKIVKAFRVSPDFNPDRIRKYQVDLVLLDAFSPNELGGTGETFDWEVTMTVKDFASRLCLAGGLDAENVSFAIHQYQPFAVDACSLLEAEKGKKNPVKLFDFIVAAKHAERSSIKNIYRLLEAIEQRPTMYLGSQSLTALFNFLCGFEYGHDVTRTDLATRHFFLAFDKWSINRVTGKNDSPYRWIGAILRKCENDEESSFDLFFKLLKEFKVENEDLDYDEF